MAYSKKVIDKFENTLNEPEKNSVGRWNPSDTDIGTGMVGAPACGDVMRLQIKCEPKNKNGDQPFIYWKRILPAPALP